MAVYVFLIFDFAGGFPVCPGRTGTVFPHGLADGNNEGGEPYEQQDPRDNQNDKCIFIHENNISR